MKYLKRMGQKERNKYGLLGHSRLIESLPPAQLSNYVGFRKQEKKKKRKKERKKETLNQLEC